MREFPTIYNENLKNVLNRLRFIIQEHAQRGRYQNPPGTVTRFVNRPSTHVVVVVVVARWLDSLRGNRRVRYTVVWRSRAIASRCRHCGRFAPGLPFVRIAILFARVTRVLTTVRRLRGSPPRNSCRTTLRKRRRLRENSAVLVAGFSPRLAARHPSGPPDTDRREPSKLDPDGTTALAFCTAAVDSRRLRCGRAHARAVFLGLPYRQRNMSRPPPPSTPMSDMLRFDLPLESR